MEQDTIAAISTAVSNSGIGIIRISGKDAVAVADRVYRSKGGKKRLADQPTHTIHYGYIVDQGETVDEVLVMLMRGPKSFTAEDTVEVNCHGGVYAMKRVLDVVLKNGARPAEPGEFTKRAFLNGRIDLSQAESVMDVIQAKNEYALKSSLQQLKGAVRTAIEELRASAAENTFRADRILGKWPDIKGRHPHGHFRKAECRKILAAERAGRRRAGDCDGYCRDDARCFRGNDRISGHYPESDRYSRNPRDGGGRGKNRRRPGD